MAQVRLIGPEPVTVPELGPERLVHPDELVTVPDDRYDGYVCQTSTWEGVQPPKDPADQALAALASGEAVLSKAAAKKTAAKAPQKGEG